ncbi:MAG: response regulator [Candidatus Rokuibacteriota bacterium]
MPRTAVLAGVTILLVDDHDESRDVLRTWLESAGARVLEAGDGEYALGVVATLVPAVIISDLRLPKLDGLTLARMIRAHAQVARIKLIAVTGVESAEARAAAREAGFDEYLPRPVDGEALIKLVNRLVLSGASTPRAPSR